MAPARPLVEIFQRLLLVVFGTVVGLALAEAAARALYRQPWHERLIAEQLESEQLPYRENSFGLRDEEIEVPRPPGALRVLLLGDSFTWGAGVTDEDAIFPALLERELDSQAERFGAGSVDVLNAGVPGSLTDQWVRIWREVGPLYDPDLVVMVFFLRDGTRTASIPEFFGVIRDEITARNRAQRRYRWSYLYRIWQDGRDRQAIASRYTRRFQASYFGTSTERQEWIRAQRNLSVIRDEARASGVEVAFVVFPVLVDMAPSSYPFQRICDEIERWAKEAGFPTHSLLPAFLGESGPDLWVSSANQHPNARGHAIAAESMMPFVAELLASAPRERGEGP